MKGRKVLRKNLRADIFKVCLCNETYLHKTCKGQIIRVFCGKCNATWMEVTIEDEGKSLPIKLSV